MAAEILLLSRRGNLRAVSSRGVLMAVLFHLMAMILPSASDKNGNDMRVMAIMNLLRNEMDICNQIGGIIFRFYYT